MLSLRIIAAPEAAQDRVEVAVNDMLKAITAYMEKSGGKLPEPTDPNPQVRRLAEAIAFVRNEKIRHMMKMTYEKEGGNA